MASFASSMRAGKRGEDQVESLLARAGLPSEKSSGKFSGWDILSNIEGAPFTVEVKYDLEQARTGNAAIEFFNPKSGEASGINATKADIWAHVVRPDRVFLAAVPALKTFLAKTRPIRTVFAAGDGNASIWLYDWNDMLGALEDTTGLTGGELLTLIRGMLKRENP